MTNVASLDLDDGRAAGTDPLALAVGCEFEFDAAQSVTAILQVAPALAVGASMRRESWESDAVHHGYIDGYGNRCERFALAAGTSRLTYAAELSLVSAADVIEPDIPSSRPGRPIRGRPRPTPTEQARGCAVTLPICRSPSAGR